MPRGDENSAGVGGEAAKELRQYMNDVQQTKKEREDLENEFKNATVDMQSKFLQALAAEGYLDAERITNQHIDEVYGGFKTNVAEILEKQQELVDKIQVMKLKEIRIGSFCNGKIMCGWQSILEWLKSRE